MKFLIFLFFLLIAELFRRVEGLIEANNTAAGSWTNSIRLDSFNWFACCIFVKMIVTRSWHPSISMALRKLNETCIPVQPKNNLFFGCILQVYHYKLKYLNTCIYVMNYDYQIRYFATNIPVFVKREFCKSKVYRCFWKFWCTFQIIHASSQSWTSVMYFHFNCFFSSAGVHLLWFFFDALLFLSLTKTNHYQTFCTAGNCLRSILKQGILFRQTNCSNESHIFKGIWQVSHRNQFLHQNFFHMFEEEHLRKIKVSAKFRNLLKMFCGIDPVVYNKHVSEVGLTERMYGICPPFLDDVSSKKVFKWNKLKRLYVLFQDLSICLSLCLDGLMKQMNFRRKQKKNSYFLRFFDSL